MYSKMVARQLAEATEVAAAVGKNADTVAAALLERMAKNPANPSPVDWKAVLESLAQTLLEASASLAEQDSELQIHFLLEKQTRDRRDRAIERLRNQLRGARFLLDQAFGKEKASGFFPERAAVAQVRPRNLPPLARSIALVLRGTEIDWPSLEDEDHLPDPQRLATRLEATADDLAEILAALPAERGGTVFSRGTKNAEYEATRKAVSTTTMALAGLFRSAGFDYAAQRLRPSRKRGKRRGETAAASACRENL
jgi:hypothetical protein